MWWKIGLSVVAGLVLFRILVRLPAALRRWRVVRAVRAGSIERLDGFLADGLDLFDADIAVLHMAAHYGNPETLTYLISLASPPLINAMDRTHGTPLHYAAARGRTDAARLLLDAGAEVDLIDPSPWGFTALHLAIINDHDDIVRLLLEAGAAPMILTRHGSSPADLARRRGRDLLAGVLERATIAYHEASIRGTRDAAANVELQPRSWSQVSLLGGARRYPSAIIDTRGCLHALCHGDDSLLYATWASGVVESRILVQPGEGLGHTALCTSEGPGVVAAWAAAGILKWMRVDAGPCEVRSAGSTDGGRFGALLDPDGILHLACSSPAGVRYLEVQPDGNVRREEVAHPPGLMPSHASLGLDAKGQPHLAVLVDLALRYGTNTSGAWKWTQVDHGDELGDAPSLVVAADGTPIVAYYLDRQLKLGRLEGRVWQVEPVDRTFGTGCLNCLAVGPGRRLHASYWDGRNAGRVRYAEGDSAGWRISEVPMENLGRHSALAIDPKGRVAVVVLENEGGVLRACFPG